MSSSVYPRTFRTAVSFKDPKSSGDGFAVGPIYALRREWNVKAALELYYASAAASVGGLGTTDTMMALKDWLELASSSGWRNCS